METTATLCPRRSSSRQSSAVWIVRPPSHFCPLTTARILTYSRYTLNAASAAVWAVLGPYQATCLPSGGVAPYPLSTQTCRHAGMQKGREFMTRTQDRKLGVGIIGLGWVAGEHIKAYQQNPHCEMVALASHSKENAESYQQRYNLPDANLYTDWQRLLQDERVDVVSICSTNEMHAPQAIAAAEAGKHVLIEKPVALTLEDLRQVERAVEKAGVKSQGGFELHWSPYFQSVHSMIDAGFFGDIYYAECDYFSGNWEQWYPG